MPFYVSTSLGFITNTNYRPENPKACCNRERAGDARYAHGFTTRAEADRFAKLLTENAYWPRYHKYYSILEPAAATLSQPVRIQQDTKVPESKIDSVNALSRFGRAMRSVLA